MSTTLSGPHLKVWYPALAAKLGDKELDELARLLAAVKKDAIAEALATARSQMG
ncbi:MAG TPA: hypothetical protein VFI25_10700 [Planctomycetota bacterium]|nr:hypothetical protein [Planctomycetota bacterium]